jgi:phosphinothricin acetyltransferase
MIEIRLARAEDLGRLTEINNHYILNTNSTFDIEPHTVDQRKSWFEKYNSTGPYQLLVAEHAGVVIGCAYSSRYRDHFSFNHTVETSVYLAHDQRTKGVGSLLYNALFSKLKSEKLHLAVVGIALPNEASIALHKKFEFEEVGIFKEYAIKHGKYISSIWMQKKLGDS